jgi:hypothetical protein
MRNKIVVMYQPQEEDIFYLLNGSLREIFFPGRD